MLSRSACRQHYGTRKQPRRPTSHSSPHTSLTFKTKILIISDPVAIAADQRLHSPLCLEAEHRKQPERQLCSRNRGRGQGWVNFPLQQTQLDDRAKEGTRGGPDAGLPDQTVSPREDFGNPAEPPLVPR